MSDFTEYNQMIGAYNSWKKDRLIKQGKFLYKKDICKLHNLTIKQFNNIMIKNNILNRDLSVKTFGKNIIEKVSGSWTKGTYFYNYELIKNLL
jgi:hypothetical protein